MRRTEQKKLTVSRVLFHWRFPVIIVLILMVLFAALVGFVVHKLSQPKPEDLPTTAEIYQEAVYDTLLAEQNEIQPVISLASDSDQVERDENGRVLMCMWHRYPDTYKSGTEVTLSYGDVTAVSAKELANWYAAHKDELTEDPTLRLQQLLGLPPLSEGNANTHFTTFWVQPENVIRPAYVSDVTNTAMTNAFTATPNTDYLSWFYTHIAYCYTQTNTAWTRLGYTYDWSDSESEYGLSEFLVPNGKPITIVNTASTSEYLQQLAVNASNEKAAAADEKKDDKNADQKADDKKDDKKADDKKAA